MFLEELVVLAFITVAVAVLGIVCAIGWCVEGDKRKADKNVMNRLAYENKILRDRLRRIEAIENIKAANEFNNQLDREGGNK